MWPSQVNHCCTHWSMHQVFKNHQTSKAPSGKRFEASTWSTEALSSIDPVFHVPLDDNCSSWFMMAFCGLPVFHPLVITGSSLPRKQAIRKPVQVSCLCKVLLPTMTSISSLYFGQNSKFQTTDSPLPSLSINLLRTLWINK